MEGETLIQLSVQLPVSELGRLAELVGQLHQLMSEGRAAPEPASAPATGERSENGSFDPTRFMALQEGNMAPASPDRQSIFPGRSKAADDPAQETSTGTDAAQPLPSFPSEAGSAGANLSNIPGGVQQQDEPRPNAAVTPSHFPEVDQQARDASAGREETERRIPAPSTAGFPVENAVELLSAGRSGQEEELITASPAPLTAEAVSLAFRRDDRRYDNGFPLY